MQIVGGGDNAHEDRYMTHPTIGQQCLVIRQAKPKAYHIPLEHLR